MEKTDTGKWSAKPPDAPTAGPAPSFAPTPVPAVERRPATARPRLLAACVVGFLAATGLLSLPGCDDARDIAADAAHAEFSYAFERDAEGWTVAFADLPVDYDPSIYELQSGYRPLPDGLPGSGIFVQGHNRSDDLFMFLYRQVGGLVPQAAYAVSVSLDLATNVPTGAFGIGGSPGAGVFVKAGASTVEPDTFVAADRHLRMNLDKGNQSRGGQAMAVLGNVAHPQVRNREYRVKTLDGPDLPVTVQADDDGRLWLVVGTDSGFEGLTALYYARIAFTLDLQPAP